jgi:hypothetical protein
MTATFARLGTGWLKEANRDSNRKKPAKSTLFGAGRGIPLSNPALDSCVFPLAKARVGSVLPSFVVGRLLNE